MHGRCNGTVQAGGRARRAEYNKVETTRRDPGWLGATLELSVWDPRYGTHPVVKWMRESLHWPDQLHPPIRYYACTQWTAFTCASIGLYTSKPRVQSLQPLVRTARNFLPAWPGSSPVSLPRGH